MRNLYNQDYFMDSKFSNYKNYDERSYKQLAVDIKNVLMGDDIHTILDFGCATGKLVKELVDVGYEAFGYDISEWAISHGKEIYPKIADRISCNEFPPSSDVIVCLDVLEHLTWSELLTMLETFKFINPKKLILRIPVCKNLGDDYVLECSKNDDTHKLKYTKGLWCQILAEFGFIISAVINKEDIYDSEGVLCAFFKNTNNPTKDDIQAEYYKNRGLEPKHFIMMNDWLSLVDSNNPNVIDFGCGLGHYGHAFDELTQEGGYSGVEVNEWAVKNTPYKNLSINNLDILDITHSNDMFDLVLLIDILEHLKYEDIDKAIDNVKNAGDMLVVSIPYKGTYNCDNDPTHIIKEDRDWWVKKFLEHDLKEVEVPEHFLYRPQLLIFKK